MNFTTVQISGDEAVASLLAYRGRFSVTRQYPFLVGDGDDLSRHNESATLNTKDPAAIIAASFEINPTNWINNRRKQEREIGYSAYDTIAGQWPGEIREKGSIGLHKNVLTGAIKPVVYLGLAGIYEAWHLPAYAKYGGWNECPESEVHCAFLRDWQERFGAEIASMSGDVVECIVQRPPTERHTAMKSAWEQYWYCADIVEQGCGSVSELAAILLNSPYWYFWWD